MMHTAWKLFEQRADGTIGPLFINKQQVIPIGEWLESESVPTKGFKVNRGWHMCAAAVAPHLKLKPKGKRPRVWCEVEYSGWTHHRNRPEAQGGSWILAERMRVLEIFPNMKGVTK